MKRYTTLLASLIFLPIVTYAMHNLMQAEQDFYAGNITAYQFINEIENGLYGHVIAQEMRLIHSADYFSHPHIDNLYQELIDMLEWLRRHEDPSLLQRFMVLNIDMKYEMLMDYAEANPLLFPYAGG